jgi:cell division protein FtsI (penicillin-binding protein 3)
VFKEISQQIIRCFDSSIGEVPTIDREDISKPVKVQLASSAAEAVAANGETPETEDLLPDFRGMTLKNALKVAQEREIDIKVVGSGWAVSQIPTAGSAIRKNRACTVYFTAGH